MTIKEHIEKYNEYEKCGKFNEDINPVDWSQCFPVTENFEYIPKSISVKFSNWVKKTFIISPFSWKQNKFIYKTKVVGRENLKGIKSAILTSNHIDIFDCLALKYATKKKKIKYVVAEYNNRKGFLGDMMRAQGILPLSKKLSVMKYFSNAVEHYLLHNHYVVFYPEQSMWYMYEKPRPLKDGAFHYAKKFNIPVIPVFITFRDGKKEDENGVKKKYLTVNILKPIYPNDQIIKNKDIERMKNENEKMCKECYENFYNKKLTYGEIKK